MANALVNLNYSCVSFKFFFEETHLLHKIMCVRIKKSWRVFPLVSTVLGGILTKPPFKRRDFSSATHRKGNAELTLALGPCSQAAWGHQVDSGGSSILGFLLGTGAEGKVNTLGSPEPLLGEPWGGSGVCLISDGEYQWKTREESIEFDWNWLCDPE